MSHLSTPISVGAMVFYSFLTFFLGPLITRPFMSDHPDQCIAGFLLGFTISILSTFFATQNILNIDTKKLDI